jgi:IclR family pca regulon transcriptional regulator
MSEDVAKQRSSDFVQSLERGLAVIRAFDAEHAELTLSDVARATDLTRAAARRFLHTLVDLGYVRTDGRLFALRPRVLELGYSFLSSMSLPELALPHMEQLSATIHESCSVAVLDGDDIVYVARVVTRRIMTVAINVGTRFPAYATSMGRVLLAHQPDDWLEHYLSVTTLEPITPKTVTDPGQLRRGLERVRAASGQVIAAMNLSLHVSRGSIDAARREMLPLMQDCARAIETDFGLRDRTRQKG